VGALVENSAFVGKLKQIRGFVGEIQAKRSSVGEIETKHLFVGEFVTFYFLHTQVCASMSTTIRVVSCLGMAPRVVCLDPDHTALRTRW